MPDEKKRQIQKDNRTEIVSNSGFTEELDKEMKIADPTPIENAYGNLSECYVSKTGHTRLFTATKYGKRYMLKCLKKDFLYTPVYQQALTKEFEIGLQLEHPNICRTLGLEQLPELGKTIVMEYIDGDTLQKLIDKKLLTAELAHKVVAQLMDALEYMHSKQMIHRDLKPSNIMVTHTGQNVKMIDFGVSDSDVFYILKLPAGTTGYIAPEQLSPKAKAEPRADIYSLGMVIDDMAKATNDKSLGRWAKICTDTDIHRRPDSIDKLRKYPLDKSSDTPIIVLLSVINLALLGLICFFYVHRNLTSREVEERKELPANTDSSQLNDNKILDYHLWNRQE